MAKRALPPGSKLPFLPPEQIEQEAAVLLVEYGVKHGMVTEPPVPVDEIVEMYLELKLELIDMQKEFGVDDVHGALWVNQRRVGIDSRLDPEVNPTKLGRYHFTLAHEAGHWRLHRHLFQRKANQLHLVPEGFERPEYICRSSDREPIELQADRFAAALLMPRDMVKRSWHEWRGSMDPIYLDDLRPKQQEILNAELMRRGSIPLGDDATDKMLLEFVARPLAEKFEVSAQAMRYRLENVGLLKTKKENMLFS